MHRPFTVLDGGLSTVLEAAGHDLRHDLWTARLITEQPEALVEAHRSFLQAGAEVIITSSYQASVGGFEAAGLSRAEAEAALQSTTALAREAVGDGNALVAASVGPYGATLANGSEYHGRYELSHDELVDFHRSRLTLLIGSAPDLLAIETIPSVAEARALAEALDGLDTPPVWFAFTARDGGHTAGGDRIEDAIAVASGIPGVTTVGVNCTSPEFIGELLRRSATVTDLPLLAYANGGQVWNAGLGVWEGPPVAADDRTVVSEWLDAGARVVGGCCGVGASGIAGLRAWRDEIPR